MSLTSPSPVSDAAPVSRRGRRAALLAVVAVSSLALTACGGGATGNGEGASGSASAEASGEASGETVTVEHAQGTTEVPVDPEKVFVFDLGVMDSMNALGEQPAGVPEAVYPEQLQPVADAAEVKIGAMKEPDFETIASEAPDLIIISARTAEAYPELSRIAPTIDLSVDQSDQMGSFEENVTTLGAVFGKEQEAADRLEAVEAKVEDAKSTLKEAGDTDGLVVLTSAGEVTAYGAGSRFGLIHDVLGIPTAADVKAEGPHGQSVSFEFIAQADPENLFVIDRDAATGEGGDTAAAVLDNDLVNGTKAARNGNVIQLDPADWYLVGYGLDSLPRMIDEVVNGVVTESTTDAGSAEGDDSGN
ncbi:siderophore ABC transporter substrate-binding protein [Citricoccus sp. SGAir0253]|uniref:siderophore ABC transporter substrate-binding protein n=1 Tax=Citricoccus sp. SGAir0253 TaxID=2567881 RepID=UPI0010CCC10B|nr:siderophore ABC transporter substrate-binding protein [Citricoccus sp. SGAir0253]QCU77605.1 siderophore ABC transporter substrate-binding protein [Citricoccus sp. SGAir0253]